jgi:hypothetical protein
MTRSRLHTVLALLAVALAGPAQADSDSGDTWTHLPYRLGQGLTYPNLGLNIGGYISVRYEDIKDRDWSIGARDLSLFFSENLNNRWQLFSELEIGQAVDVSPNSISERDSEVDLERLYADYRATRTATLRIGKFLTPMGHWNQIHADPLVWTVDRPLTTAAAFARHATGAMVYGAFSALGNNWDYKLFIDDSDMLDPSQQKELAFEDGSTEISPHNAFERAAGARLSYHFLDDSANIGASFLHCKMYDLQERKDLYGLDAMWTVKRMEFSGEWIYRTSRGDLESSEHGGFVQAALPLSEHLYVIARQERYKAAVLAATATINSAGLTYRPHPAVAVKFEYRGGSHNEPLAATGWLGSLAVLF